MPNLLRRNRSRIGVSCGIFAGIVVLTAPTAFDSFLAPRWKQCTAAAAVAAPLGDGEAASEQSSPANAATPEFRRIQRPGAVDVAQEYDLSNLKIPIEEIHELLPRDAIPALTEPKTERARSVEWLESEDRVVEIVIGREAVAVPLRVLNWHEVANMTVAGRPVAATYCPLCDSASVISRRIERRLEGGTTGVEVLEFGVSGALYNSNVLMYDRKHKGLWSQLGMVAVSGPLAGTSLDHLPVRVVPFSSFVRDHPNGKVVSKDTGHDRDYSGSPYASYFRHERLMVPVKGVCAALPRKTLGLGVLAADDAWFIPADEIGERFVLATPLGDVVAAKGDAGIVVESSPEGVRTAQTFYYSWSAFHPQTQVVSADGGKPGAGGR